MILLVLTTLATAASHPYSAFDVTDLEERKITSAEYERCMSRSLHNEEAVECIRDEWDHLDKQLNASYRAALAKASNNRMRERLRSDQRRWLRDRGEECSVENAGGHTPYELAVHQCEIDEPIRRIAWLRHLTHPQR